MGKLKKTMDLIRSRKAQNTLYDVAVANADRLFQAGDYDLANEEYENASRILPSEQYPKQKINEIVKIKVEAADQGRGVCSVNKKRRTNITMPKTGNRPFLNIRMLQK